MPSAQPPGMEGHRAADEWFLWSLSNSDRLAWLINTEHSRLQRQLWVQLTFLFSVRVWGRAASAAGTRRPSSPAACPTWCVCTSTSSRRSPCSSCCSMPKVGWSVPRWPVLWCGFISPEMGDLSPNSCSTSLLWVLSEEEDPGDQPAPPERGTVLTCALCSGINRHRGNFNVNACWESWALFRDRVLFPCLH